MERFIRLAIIIFLNFVLSHENLPNQCDVAINEINSDDIGRPGEFLEFIELKATCPTGAKLRDYILIIIKEYDERLKGPAIVFSADLYQQSFKKDYFVLGSPNDQMKDKIDMPFTSSSIMYYRKAQQSVSTTITSFFKKTNAPDALQDVLPNGNDFPMAAILLKDTSDGTERDPELLKVRLTYRDSGHRQKTVPHLKVGETLKAEIKKYLHDIAIYSRRSVFNDCGFFKELITLPDSTEYAELNLPAREWDTLGHRDMSLNRCPKNIADSKKPFILGQWKLGSLTPGEKNDCKGDKWIIEENLGGTDGILHDQGMDADDVPSIFARPRNPTPPQCSSSSSVARMTHVRSASAATNRDRAVSQAESSSGTCPVTTPAVRAHDVEQDQMCDKILHLLEERMKANQVPTTTPSTPADEPATKRMRCSDTQTVEHILPWDDSSHFTTGMVRQIKQHQANYVNVDWLTGAKKTWLEYLFNAADPAKSKFRCRFCAAYVMHHGFTANVPDLAQEEGFLGEKESMRQQLKNHPKLSTHINAIKELKTAHGNKMKECMQKWQKDANEAASERDKITARMIRTVYSETLKNIPLETHAELVSLQRLNGLDMGVHHYERSSATRMLECISGKMKETLIDFLKNSQQPLSILVDSTTDASVKNYLAVYIRTLQGGMPRMFFLHLLLVQSEKAEDLKTLMIERFNRDGIFEAIRDRTVGFASDGASVMMGNTGGLGALLSGPTGVGRPLYRIHCAPHKLQLALGHAYEQPNLIFLKTTLENTVNNIYSFYNRNAVKRKASLRNTAEALGETLYELNYIFKIRWVSSEHSALKRINDNYITLLTNLEEIRVSPDFAQDETTRNLALGHSNSLLNVRFRAIMLFLMDLLNLLKMESLRLQQTAGTVIGMEKFRDELIKSANRLKIEDGPALKAFLTTYKCFKDVGRLVYCKAKDMDDKDFVLNEQFTLKVGGDEGARTTRNQFPKLSSIRDDIIESLVIQLLAYFPEGAMTLFDVLLPENLPSATSEVFTYAGKVTALAQKFNVDETIAANELAILLYSLIDDHGTDFCTYKQEKNPVDFWGHFLGTPTVMWSPHIKKLIEIVLALPIATADVERGFSILTHTRGERRSRLTVAHLEDMLFLKLNGPSLKDFDALKYTKAWYAKGGMRSNDPRQKRAKQKNELPKSTIF